MRPCRDGAPARASELPSRISRLIPCGSAALGHKNRIAGAQARVSNGIVITFGMLVGNAFTLFVVSVIYSFVARQHRRETAHASA